jgi:molecular chaperone IbpA
MRFDFTPFYRSAIGFDRLFDAVELQQGSFPHHNVERLGDDDYRITLAVAGFSEADVSIELKEQVLTISGSRDDGDKKYVFRGIAARSFERKFQLADHVEVVSAAMENGLLHVDLRRIVPESKRPRKIEIGRPQMQIAA